MTTATIWMYGYGCKKRQVLRSAVEARERFAPVDTCYPTQGCPGSERPEEYAVRPVLVRERLPACLCPACWPQDLFLLSFSEGQKEWLHLSLCPWPVAWWGPQRSGCQKGTPPQCPAKPHRRLGSQLHRSVWPTLLPRRTRLQSWEHHRWRRHRDTNAARIYALMDNFWSSEVQPKMTQCMPYENVPLYSSMGWQHGSIHSKHQVSQTCIGTSRSTNV